jgi:hypothetical protein
MKTHRTGNRVAVEHRDPIYSEFGCAMRKLFGHRARSQEAERRTAM